MNGTQKASAIVGGLSLILFIGGIATVLNTHVEILSDTDQTSALQAIGNGFTMIGFGVFGLIIASVLGVVGLLSSRSKIRSQGKGGSSDSM